MRKRRSDSPWGKLTGQQERQLDQWLFMENLSYEAILKKLEAEHGIETSRVSLASYRKQRKELRESLLEDFVKKVEAEERIAKGLENRLGMGVPIEELENRTMYCVAMAAYELAMAEPEKLRVKELRWLVKMLQDRRPNSHLEMDGIEGSSGSCEKPTEEQKSEAM
jgi:hypothetical protein